MSRPLSLAPTGPYRPLQADPARGEVVAQHDHQAAGRGIRRGRRRPRGHRLDAGAEVALQPLDGLRVLSARVVVDHRLVRRLDALGTADLEPERLEGPADPVAE